MSNVWCVHDAGQLWHTGHYWEAGGRSQWNTYTLQEGEQSALITHYLIFIYISTFIMKRLKN